MVVKEHPEVYRESVLGVGSTGLGPRIAAILRSAPVNIAAMRKLSDSLEGDLSVYLSGFQKTSRIFLPEPHLFTRLARCI
jgi:hypothetical protein